MSDRTEDMLVSKGDSRVCSEWIDSTSAKCFQSSVSMRQGAIRSLNTGIASLFALVLERLIVLASSIRSDGSSLRDCELSVRYGAFSLSNTVRIS